MAEVISDAGLFKQLLRRFGIRGSAQVGLESVIYLMANTQDLDEPPFHSKGGGVFNLAGGPVAAQISYIGIRAPLLLPPNFRAVCKTFINLSAQTVVVKNINSAVMDAALGAPALNVISGRWDSAEPDEPDPKTAMQSVQINSVTSLGSPDGFILGAAVGGASPTQPVHMKWNIAPGNTLVFQGTTVNVGVQAGFYWDEYYLG